MLHMSHDAKVILLPDADIGGTNTAAIDATYWAPAHDVRGYHDIYAKVRLGTWNASDDLDTCKLQQCTAADGTGAKDLTTSASGGDYDTDYPVDAVTNTVVFDVRTSQMDIANGYYYVRLYAAEGGNTGTDNVSGVIILYNAREKGAEKEGAASAGVTVYVTT
jgi:hypothetical protein